MSRSEKRKASAFSLIAGILILINAALLGAATTWFPWTIPTIPGTSNDAVPFTALTVVGLMCGTIILFGSLMLRGKLANKKAWGTIIIAFSVPSVIMGGGFVIGFILGIISGAKALKSKPEM